MQRLICSLVTVASLSAPSTALAQEYGRGLYLPHHNNWQQNQGGGDTVDYEGQILTNNLIPNRDTCDWVREVARLPCQYFRYESNSSGYTTHFVGRPRRNHQNIHQGQNLNQPYQPPIKQRRFPSKQRHIPYSNVNPFPVYSVPIGVPYLHQNRGGCVYQNKHVRILCN